MYGGYDDYSSHFIFGKPVEQRPATPPPKEENKPSFKPIFDGRPMSEPVFSSNHNSQIDELIKRVENISSMCKEVLYDLNNLKK